MALVGFHFTKMHVEKTKPAKGKISAKNNLHVAEVKEAKLNGPQNQGGVEFAFKFKVNYTPDIGHIELEGKIVYMGTSDKVKEIMDKWKKEKNLPKDTIAEVYNYLLHKSNIQSLVLGQTMNLPAHIVMPRVEAK